jgi:hypothetical protein
MGERPSEVSELATRMWIDFLGRTDSVDRLRKQLLAQHPARATPPISVSEQTNQNKQIVHVPYSPSKPSSVPRPVAHYQLLHGELIGDRQ